MASDQVIQNLVDSFYRDNGKCCAGCDHWQWHNATIGDCTKSAPVSSKDRISMIDIDIEVRAGHIVTDRSHVCGEFADSFDWEIKKPLG